MRNDTKFWIRLLVIWNITFTDNCYLRHLHRSKGEEEKRKPRSRTVFNCNIQSQVENEADKVNVLETCNEQQAAS